MGDSAGENQEVHKNCLICTVFESTEIIESPLVQLGKKQIENFKRSSLERSDTLHDKLTLNTRIYVHDKCRKKYVQNSYIQAYKKNKNENTSTEDVEPTKKEN